MKIKIRFFAQLRDLMKMEEETIELRDQATVADLRQNLKQRFPTLENHLNSVSFAVDNEYVTKTTVLRDGNEVALLPPISGG